jgi:hypothetical protein
LTQPSFIGETAQTNLEQGFGGRLILAGEPNYGGWFPETLPRMVAESTSKPNTNGYETRSLKQKQRIYLLKTIMKKNQEICKNG